MKFLTALFFTFSLFSLCLLSAQDASVVPLPDSVPNEPPPSTPKTQPTPPPLSLIPDMPAPVEKPRGSGGGSAAKTSADNPVKKNKTQANADEIADRIKFREAKTKALRDEKLQQQREIADAAKTDHEKRAALKQYYTMLYGRILKIDGSIKKLVSQRLQQSLKELDQSKVKPEEYQ